MARKIVQSPEKIIRVRCQGAELVRWRDVLPFQGELKSLSEGAYHALLSAMLRNGITSALDLWKSDGAMYTLDGHQRCRVFEKAEQDGYTVPEKVPVNWVEADSHQQAKDILLTHASQFGKIERQGLYEFLHESGLSHEALGDRYRMPEIDFDQFNLEFYKDEQAPGQSTAVAAAQDLYTRKIESPIYEPRGAEPPLTDLFNRDKAKALIAEIDAAEIPADVKDFLRFSAYRHVAFNYQNIAEYYAHAPKEVQRLMENSALVIIDFNKAIEQGFVVVSEKIAEVYSDAST